MPSRYTRIMDNPVPSEVLDQYSNTLTLIAEKHRLSNLRHGGVGTIIADADEGCTYFDLIHFEDDASGITRYDVSVVTSGAPIAAEITGRKLSHSTAA